MDVLVPSAAKLDLLKQIGIPFKTLTADLGAQELEARKADAAYKASVAATGSPLPTGRSTYRTPDDYPAELKDIVAKYPAIARPVVIGHTYQGREIQGVEISDKVAAKDDGKPTYFLVALHHAREWPSAEIAMEFAWLLAKGYGSDAQITSLLKKERVVIVPVINADGFVASRGTAEDGFIPDPVRLDRRPRGRHRRGRRRAVRRQPRLPAQELRRPGAEPRRRRARLPLLLPVGRRPEPQLRRGLGRPGREPRPEHAGLPRRRPVVRARDPGGPRVLADASGHGDHHAAQRRRARAAPAGPAHGRQGARRGHAQGARRRDGGRHRLHVAVRLPALRHLGHDRGLELRRARARSATRSRSAREGGQFHMAYETGVVEQWLGPHTDPADATSPRKGGMRLALLTAATAAADSTKHSIVEGKAPAGRVLRLSKSFETKSSPVCTFAQGYVRAGTIPAADCVAPGAQRSQADKLEYTTVVGKDGRYSWHVTPSTRPFVGSRNVAGEATSRVTTFTGDGQGSAPAQGETKEYGFDVPASDYTRNLDIKLSWTAAPEDYDLYLYYVKPDGERVPIGEGQAVDGVLIYTDPGAGQNPNGLPEHIIVTAPPAGHYVAAVVNNQGVLNDYTLTATATGEKPGHVESTGVTEPFDLTCELPDGTSRTTRHGVVVSRGGRVTVNFDSKSC